MKLQKFKLQRYKKNGTEIVPVKIKSGLWIEPHSDEEYQKNMDQNAKNKELGLKERFIYYPGTRVPHIHLMELKNRDKYNLICGGPMPWTDPSTIEVNEELLNTENIYEKLEQAKKENDKNQIDILTRPLVSWRCPQTQARKSLYPQAVTITNRNNKSDFVYDNLQRYEEAVVKLDKIYREEYVNNVTGISALINLLSAKFCFRVGNNEESNSGVGVTTFKPKHIEIDEKGRMHFRFIGKKGVKWHKTFKPENEIEQLMYDGVLALKEKNNDFLFWFCGKRVTSGEANYLFKKVMNVQENEKDYLTFHSWRHFNATKGFLKELETIKIEKKFKKIDDGRSKNKELTKAREINKQMNEIFSVVCKLLTDTPGVVKSTYAGGKIFKEFYEKNGIQYDEKKRTFIKAQFDIASIEEAA